jgi:hypothetical protein
LASKTFLEYDVNVIDAPVTAVKKLGMFPELKTYEYPHAGT